MKKVGLFAYGQTGLFALKSLLRKFEVSFIITPPSNARKTENEILPVESLAKENKIEIFKIKGKKKLLNIFNKKKADAVIISTYNQMLGSDILKSSRFINIHHGDLPRFRGRANINWAIINNRKKIGLTYHEATPVLDGGNIYAQYLVPITASDTVSSMYDKFNRIIEKDTGKIVEEVLNGLKGKKQKGKATYCCTRLPEDGYIDWQKKSREIDNLVKALTTPYPGAFTYYEGKKILIWTCEIPKKTKVYEGRIPGRITEIIKGYGVEVLTGDSSIIIKDVTYQGKNTNASYVISTVKTTLGISLPKLYEQIQELLRTQR